ncbi:HTH CENPB-type domain-containing protein [Meloidogyne graminicola]|uniref:HTH CENPB-type domain-containing protein n=1 Tax=Meloidogyne graminicola TaxID=189291 RepID=A0A8S9ZVR4_9BILA|nr:HTH CENPB-type domain-containing protein [Meloidogyne graminicola]
MFNFYITCCFLILFSFFFNLKNYLIFKLYFFTMSVICCICNKPTSGAHSCKNCLQPCHAIQPCSFLDGEEEGYGSQVLCVDCRNLDEIESDGSSSKKNDDNSNKTTLKRKCRAISIEEKLRILEVATKSSIHSASKQCGVDRQNIREWKRNEKALRGIVHLKLKSKFRKRIVGGGRKLTDADFDKELADWVRELRKKNLRVSRKMLVVQALKMCDSKYNNLKDKFKASHGWLESFFKRHNFSFRRPTSVAQKHPEEYTKIIIDFILYVQKLWKENDYKHVYACDETSVWLDPTGGNCITEKGSKTVNVLTTGHEKVRVTVLGNFYFESRLLRLAVHTAIVPGGTTKFIQPPDLAWNGPFKKYIHEMHSNWMLHTDKPTTSSGNLKAPTMEIYLDWILSSWELLSKDVIANSFVACGITKEADGKFDDAIHTYGAIPNGIILRKRRQEKECQEVTSLVEEIDLNEEENYDSDFSIEV